MALPSTGPLSGDQIDNEFPDSVDGGRPMKLSEYRGVAASKNGTDYTLPASPNSISYSDFRGVSYTNIVQVWVVGGGGGGSNSSPGGGGGAGRIESGTFNLSPGSSYSVSIGGGGGAGSGGGSSSFGTLLTASGGTGGSGSTGGTSNFPGSSSSIPVEAGGGGGTTSPGVTPIRPGADGYGGAGTTIQFNHNNGTFTKNVGGGGSGGKIDNLVGGCILNAGSGSDFGGGIGGWNRGACSGGVNGTGGGGGGNGRSGSASSGGSGVVIVRNITRGTFEEFTSNGTYTV